MKDFALIGTAGYIAPRHIQAIYDTGNRLVAAMDVHDSVGILDKHTTDVEFFTEIEKLSLFLAHNPVDYVVVCSPNHLHYAHCALAMRSGADVICEKPLAIDTYELDALKKVEKATGKKVYTVLQLRLHPELRLIKQAQAKGRKKVSIDYISPRGPWYDKSWKGDENKSGGIATNIGIHLFDFLIWLFGDVQDYKVLASTKDYSEGELTLDNADVQWKLSTDRTKLPNGVDGPFRQVIIDGIPLRFDKVFSDLHTDVYKDILNGGGYGIDDAYPSVEIVEKIR